ncbi:MAG: hypothetical protein LBO09_02090 [Candidatus Peribacteria bacterium]|nr:hypothetical protein [Candidatus Peribacteria bacterium]
MTGRLNSAKPDRRPSTLGYGPGNYYYSGVFVFANQSGSNWSKELNDNLRGGTGTELERQ